MRSFRTSWIMMLVASGALLLTACNGNGDTNGAAAPQEPGVPAPDAPAPDGGDVPGAPPPADADPNQCAIEYADLFAAENAYTNEMTLLMSGQSADPEPTVHALQAMAEVAPSELDTEFQTLADELSVYVTAAAEQGLFDFEGEPSPEQIEAMQQLDGEMNVEAVEAAQVNIDHYFTENC